jgi:uncharacterized protein
LQGESGKAPIRIWALLGARAGDNNQVIALAEALGLPFEIKQLKYNALRRLGPRLLGHSLASLNKSSRTLVLGEESPDLTISTGHRSVPLVRALRRQSRGRTRSVHVGFPRISPKHFDLVIATPQYPIANHPNLLRIPFALTRAITASSEGEDQQLASLPRPHRLLLVGGPNPFWNLDQEKLLRTLGTMLDEAIDGGAVLVSSSPRTPSPVRGTIEKALAASTAPSLLATPGKQPRYSNLLASADSIQVTADSVAMVSDAIWTGKPIATVPVARSPLGHLAMGIMDRLRPGHQLYPQDLRLFWRALADIGISERLATPRTSTDQVLRMVIDRVREVLEIRA